MSEYTATLREHQEYINWSRVYADYCSAHQELLHHYQQVLETEIDQVEVRRAQGAVMVLRQVLELPQRILEDLEESN